MPSRVSHTRRPWSVLLTFAFASGLWCAVIRFLSHLTCWFLFKFLFSFVAFYESSYKCLCYDMAWRHVGNCHYIWSHSVLMTPSFVDELTSTNRNRNNSHGRDICNVKVWSWWPSLTHVIEWKLNIIWTMDVSVANAADDGSVLPLYTTLEAKVAPLPPLAVSSGQLFPPFNQPKQLPFLGTLCVVCFVVSCSAMIMLRDRTLSHRSGQAKGVGEREAEHP